ncbi:MAG: isoleucine--tRNA ligase [Ectothiorhodospiraceae bacterium]|nr:isoleucine--tRNA ligase [Chromatiales bacterium]MCP5154977.1 isoleucine--tRNA ligase [Ectothiorhodospiraceae bacterium]
MAFDEVPGRYDGPALETAVLAFWRDQRVFERALEASAGRPLYVWNEGPPTANGRPGIHHVLARTYKDMFPRYKSMRGFHCPRKAGWDTHGLPVEHEIEKELGIFDKSRIEREVGVAEFTRRCRESVMRYIADWERMTERMGFWVNMEDAYYTLNNDYIESVWWLLRTIWDKGLIYQGHKVVPYDPRIGATLSSHEVALGYKEVEDPSVYVRFPIEGEDGVSFLVWTTTPWTLPSNLALAVHPDVDYVYVRHDDETLVLAEALVAPVLGDSAGEVLRRVKGQDLLGKRYRRPFDYLAADGGDPWRVLPAEFVSTEDGTGIVHIAPAYGEDDLRLGEANGLPIVHGVGLDGYFLPEVEPVAGKFFKEADPILTDLLRERGLLLRAERYLHNYPFGWRTGDPLIYYAKHAWYIRTTAVRDRMVELNRTINWVPPNIRDGRFGNWLENNIDWALSRERFWGTPLPVWTDGAGDFMCIGSVAELERLAGRSLRDVDLHRPAIDEVTFTHPDNGREYRRVPEVIDCWFDSGAMPYAQWHYPFENRERFEQSFPADYICEAIDQTRGWFYTLHAIATLVSDSVSFRNCVCLAHIVDKDGKKMSKSQGNIVDPYDVFDTVGADALRWYLAARIAPEAQKRISVELVADVASTFLNTLWNTYAFFVLYARLDAVDLDDAVPVAERPEIDRWVLALLDRTVTTVSDAMDRYDAQGAGQAIEGFVDQLSNWYVRRNRRRFWKSEAGRDKQSAYLTLYECLVAVSRLAAPLMPFVTESLHQNLVRKVRADAPLSVHMADWPTPIPERADAALLDAVAVVQRVVGLGRTARNDTRQRTRQPLARMLVRVPDEAAAAAVRRFEDQILEELNVKALELAPRDAQLVSYRLKPNLPRIGKRFGPRIPALREALAAADATAIATAVAAGKGFELVVGGHTEGFEPEDVLVETGSAEGWASAEDGGYLVGLDTRLTPALEREGLARELIRTVQEARKQAGLEVSDRIALHVTGSAEVEAALAEHRGLLLAETLAESAPTAGWTPSHAVQHQLGDARWSIELARKDRA